MPENQQMIHWREGDKVSTDSLFMDKLGSDRIKLHIGKDEWDFFNMPVPDLLSIGNAMILHAVEKTTREGVAANAAEHEQLKAEEAACDA